MKANLVKKLVAIGCTAVMAVSAAACGNTVNGDDVSAGKNQADYKVAIVKQMDHASLDEIANAIAAQIEENYPDVEVEVQFGGQPIYYYLISVE